MTRNCWACGADTEACECTLWPPQPRTATPPPPVARKAPEPARKPDRDNPDSLDNWTNAGTNAPGTPPGTTRTARTDTAKTDQPAEPPSDDMNNARVCVWGTQYETGPSGARAAAPGDGGGVVLEVDRAALPGRVVRVWCT